MGLYILRNEADIIETNLRHHFASVIDEAIVIDNGSIDGTMELVSELAEDLPIRLASEVGPIYQSERVTRMARFAVQEGADWVLPIDADEFWVGAGASFRAVLEDTPAEVDALFVDLVTFVQRRDVLAARPGCLVSMTMRPEHQVGPMEDLPRLVREEEVGWVEIMYTPKCVHRARPGLTVPKGNHRTGVRGGRATDRLTCLHAPMRAFSTLAGKLDHGRREAEENGPLEFEASWHMKRWWQMARERTLDREWEALSYRDGAITVGGRSHELVVDTRLRDAARAVAPLVRTTAAAVANPTEAMAPAIGAYYYALDTVPGWFSPLDFRILVELDRLQRAHGVGGDLFEIGAYYGKSAILLGHLARLPDERLTVCDVFEHVEAIDAESFPVFNHWYAGVTQQGFEEQYHRFHVGLPDIIVGPSTTVDAAGLAGTCRIVHVDGGHSYDVVRHDAATARTLLRPGGVVAFDDISTSHNPGSALAVWELVLGGAFRPLLLTDAKLYGTWDAGGIDWAARIDEWVAGEPNLGIDMHTLAGWPVRRVFAHGRPALAADRLVRIPDLEDMSGGATAEAASPAPTP